MADIVASSPVARTINLTRSTVSSGIFGLGRGAAATTQPTQKLIDTNDLSLRLISNQLSSLTARMNDIGGALERIAYYIAQDTSIEQLQTRQEQAQEKQLAEEGIRTRQESVIERKLKSALIAPVQAVAQRAQSVLQRLMQFFGTLLGGWLVMRGIDTLKALSEGNTKKLEEIRDAVIKNLAIAGGVLFAVNGGFFALAGILTSVTLNITKGLAKLIFIKPFQFIAKLVGDAVKNIVKPAATAASAGTKAASNIFSSIGKGAKSVLRGAAKIAGPAASILAGGIDFMERKGEGQTNLQAAAGTGASLAGSAAGAASGAAVGSVFGPVGTFLGGLGGGIAGFYGGGKVADVFTGVDKDKKKAEVKPTNTKTPTPPAANKKPSETKTPTPPAAKEKETNTKTSAPSAIIQPQTGEQKQSASNLTELETKLSQNTNEYISGMIGEEEYMNKRKELKSQISELKLSDDQTSEQKKYTEVSAADIQSPTQAQIAPMPVAQMQQKMEQVTSPLPEPKPTVTMLKTSSGQQGGSANQAPPITGQANSVPAISSSNPENFYTLYSQVHYNVVI